MGAWIEIFKVTESLDVLVSHPTMGAWIEIMSEIIEETYQGMSHPTMGAWIEINGYVDVKDPKGNSRTPRWVRGLK